MAALWNHRGPRLLSALPSQSLASLSWSHVAIMVQPLLLPPIPLWQFVFSKEGYRNLRCSFPIRPFQCYSQKCSCFSPSWRRQVLLLLWPVGYGRNNIAPVRGISLTELEAIAFCLVTAGLCLRNVTSLRPSGCDKPKHCKTVLKRYHVKWDEKAQRYRMYEWRTYLGVDDPALARGTIQPNPSWVPDPQNCEQGKTFALIHYVSVVCLITMCNLSTSHWRSSSRQLM